MHLPSPIRATCPAHLILLDLITRIIVYTGVKLGNRREEHRLRVFENRVLRGMFEPERDGVTGEWRRLHNEELRDVYSTPSIILAMKWRMRWAGHVARMGENKCIQGLEWGNLKARTTS
jgi:hypothetical protein